MTNAEKVGRVAPLALLALLVGSIVTIAGPTTNAYAQGEAVDFAANVEFIRGHLEKAIENKNTNSTELAIAHAGHPVEEVYALLEVEIEEHNPELNTQLEGALTALANDIDTMAVADVETAVADINTLLDQAVEEVVGEEAGEPAFWAHVATQLLETAEIEYEEAVAEGEIVEMIEYQDASAFIHRAEVAFEAIMAEMPEEEAEEVVEFFEELNSLVSENADPANVETVIGGINHEFEEVFGGAEEGAHVDSEAVGFASNVEMIKGHMSQAIKNVKTGNTELALAHAGHPVEEHFALLSPELGEHNPELETELETALTDFANNVDSMTASQTRAQAAAISRLLNSATSEVVSAETWSDHVFRAAVINALIEMVGVEYAEAVAEGEIIEQIEFQDAEAFAARANVHFRSIEGQLPAHEAEEAEEFLGELRSGMMSMADPAAMQVFVDGIIHEMQEATGLEEGEDGETTPLEYIENIEALLADLEHEYMEGEYSEADSLAVQAYLDNFEFVEAPLAEAGEEELMEEIEHLMREQLREMIAAQVPAEELSAHVDRILEKLELAEQALA